MKIAKSSKRSIGGRSPKRPATRRPTVQDIETLTAVTRALSNEIREKRMPLLGETFKAIQAEVKEAARRLGFDVSKDDWIKRVHEESNAYPCSPIEGGKAFLELIPTHTRARIQALEQIWYFTTDLLVCIEEDVPDEFDEAITELRAAMALDPTTVPLTECRKDS